ncbi:MAG: response regulator [Ignavibacteriales bacterium]
MEILLVEDNSGDILLIQTAFGEMEEVDVRFVTKTNGLDASMYISQAESIPDLVILDLNLPQRNGLEILSEINSNGKYADVPVVLFTSSNDETDKLKALSMGARTYVIKSIDFDEYKRQVTAFLNFVGS